MNIDPETVIKWCGAGAAVGTAIAGLRPFVDRWFNHWLKRVEGREDALRERERAEREDARRVLVALEGSVRVQEHMVGVLENVSDRTDAVLARLDAIVAHHGIVVGRLSTPPPPLDPRQTLTGLGLPSSPLVAPSGGPTAPRGGSGSTPGG